MLQKISNIFSFVACNCNPSGSSNLICSDVDGSCRCVSNVTGQTCSQCSYGYYNLVPGVGCSPCNCNVNGSASLQCQQGTGTCSCNSNVAGDKCDHCFNGYYNLTAGVGCRYDMLPKLKRHTQHTHTHTHTHTHKHTLYNGNVLQMYFYEGNIFWFIS